MVVRNIIFVNRGYIIFEGRTPLGRSKKVKGVPERSQPGVQTPEFRIAGADSTNRLSEVKTITGSLGREGIKRNLGKAISQVKEQKVTSETGGYIRIDASSSPPTILTTDEIAQVVKGRLLDSVQKRIDYVNFVKVLYNNATGSQRLVFRVQNGQIVLSS